MMPYRNPGYLKLAAGKPCVRCWRTDGTVVACHYSGQNAHKLGRGGSLKSSDHAVAFLCMLCHGYFDGYALDNNAERSAEFLMLCLKTQLLLLETGEIEITLTGGLSREKELS